MPGDCAAAQRKNNDPGSDTANKSTNGKAGRSGAFQKAGRRENGKKATPSRSDRNQSECEELKECAFHCKRFVLIRAIRVKHFSLSFIRLLKCAAFMVGPLVQDPLPAFSADANPPAGLDDAVLILVLNRRL